MCQAEAVKRFDGLRAEFEAFARHWDDVGRTVVLDTSAIMGLSSPDGQTSVRTVDWFALLDCPTDVALRLVVPLVVVDELDNFKDQGDNKSKPAARAALRTIEPLVVSAQRATLPQVKHDGHGLASIETFVDPPTHRRPQFADDEIVQQAALLKLLTGRPTVIATRDTGMLIRAHHSGADARRVESL